MQYPVLAPNLRGFQAAVDAGAKEVAVFAAASNYARARKIPRLYLAANSGARIGLAKTVRDAFQVAWNNENDPSQGFSYLYLTPEDLSTGQCGLACRTRAVFRFPAVGG